MSNKLTALKVAAAEVWEAAKKFIKVLFCKYRPVPKHDYPVKMLHISIDGGVAAFFRFHDQGWQTSSSVKYFPAHAKDAKEILEYVLGGLQWLPFDNALLAEAAACDINHHSDYQNFVKQLIDSIPDELPDHKGYGGTFIHTIPASKYPADLPLPQVTVSVHYGTYLFYQPVLTQHFDDEQLAIIFPNVSLEKEVNE